MKCWAKLTLNDTTAGELIRSFFSDFNPENSIFIQGNKAKVEVFFDEKPPLELMKAISNCKIDEFKYGRSLLEYDDEAEQKASEETYLEIVNQEVAAQQEVIPNKKVEHKEVETKKKKCEIEQIPKYLVFAKNAKSYQEFVRLVVDWLDLGNSREFFEAVINVAEKIERINLHSIVEKMNEGEYPFKQAKYQKCNQQISKKFCNIFDDRGKKITFVKLVDAIVSCGNYDFSKVVDDNDASTDQIRVKMECMPEIPEFEEMLGNIDKTLPTEEKTKHVLNYMGLENKDEKAQLKLLEIVNIAMKLSDINRDFILPNLSATPDESALNKWMSLSEFINNFVCQYDKSKEVKVEDFLKDLQKVIIHASEVES